MQAHHFGAAALLLFPVACQKDIGTVLANLKSKEPDRIALDGRPQTLREAIRDLGTGQAFVSSVDVDRGLFLDVRPRVSVHGGFEG